MRSIANDDIVVTFVECYFIRMVNIDCDTATPQRLIIITTKYTQFSNKNIMWNSYPLPNQTHDVEFESKMSNQCKTELKLRYTFIIAKIPDSFRENRSCCNLHNSNVFLLASISNEINRITPDI